VVGIGGAFDAAVSRHLPLIRKCSRCEQPPVCWFLIWHAPGSMRLVSDVSHGPIVLGRGWWLGLCSCACHFAAWRIGRGIDVGERAVRGEQLQALCCLSQVVVSAESPPLEHTCRGVSLGRH
jgi:hypothetical protein